MKIKFFFIAIFIVFSFYTLFSLIQPTDSNTKMTNVSQQSIPTLLLESEEDVTLNETIPDPSEVAVSLDVNQRHIIHKGNAFILEPHYHSVNETHTSYNMNVFSSILGGNVNDYNGIYYSFNLPNYPTILMRINTNEYYIFGEKYTTDFNFTISDGQVFGDLAKMAENIFLDFSIDDKNNVVVNYAERENFPKNSYVTILVYHESNIDINNNMSISPDKLRMQLNALKDANYSFITDSDLLAYIHNWRDIPDNSVIVHFDDGYESFYTNAYPVLKELNVPSSMYLLGLTVKEKTGDAETFQTPHLSWEQITQMHNEGLVSFQSHTMNLHTKGAIFQSPTETFEEYTARLENDFNSSKALIESRLITPVISLAYPIGSYDDYIDSIASKFYPLTMTMDHGVEKGDFDGYKIKRIYGNGNDTATSLVNRLDYQ